MGSLLPMILIYAVIIGLVYLFLIRPNSKKKKEEAAMRNNLEIGDEITTIGGIDWRHRRQSGRHQGRRGRAHHRNRLGQSEDEVQKMVYFFC